MHRRSLLGAFAALPFMGAAVRAEAAPVVQELKIPVGFIRDVKSTTTEFISASLPAHTHSLTYVGTHACSRVVNKQEIYDGEKFVPLDSEAGTDVLNRLFAKLRNLT